MPSEPRMARDNINLMDRIEDWSRVVGEEEERDKVIRQMSDMYVSAVEDIMQKSLHNARNPTAVIFSRIKTARDNEPIDRFIEENEIYREKEVADRVRLAATGSRGDRDFMLGSLVGARDVMAVIISRLRNIESNGRRDRDRDRHRDVRDSRRSPPRRYRSPERSGRGRDGDRDRDYHRSYNRSPPRDDYRGQLRGPRSAPSRRSRSPSRDAYRRRY